MNKLIGKKLKVLRKSRNYSLEHIIENLNVSKSTYERMEKGQTATWTSKTELICNLYQIELEELILSEKKYNILKSNLTQVSKIPDLDSVLRKTVELYERILDEKERRIADLEYKLKI